MSFWNFFSMMKVTSMPMAYFLFFLFALNVFFFQFLSRGICMHITILRAVQNGRTSLRENSHIWLKRSCWGSISEIKATSKPNFYLIFWLFIFNSIFFSSLVVGYVCTFPSYQGFRIFAKVTEKKMLVLLKDVLFEASFPWWRSLVCQLLVLYSNYLF